MTNQNPASSSKSSNLSQDILAKVNAHADRSIDRLFGDLDELLSGDLLDNIPTQPHRQQQERAAAIESVRTTSSSFNTQAPPQPAQSSPPPGAIPSQPVQPQLPPQSKPTAKNKPKNHPSWIQVLLGIGVISIALSSLLLWLINERKIQLPKQMDTSWLPFSSPSLTPDDAKFAEYMRKSISKIEAANDRSKSAIVPTTNAPAPILPQSTAIEPGVFTTAEPTNAVKPIYLVKILQGGERPAAIFEVNGQAETVAPGGKIGTSEWSLLTVANGEVIIKKSGGVVRSIYIGQKF